MKLSAHEINRKLLHILSGTAIPFGILYIPLFPHMTTMVPLIVLGILLIISCAFEYARFYYKPFQRLVTLACGYMMRPEEERKFTGATYIFASSFLCTAIFYHKPYISCMVLCAFILGDAAAALVGQSIGRIKIGKKSLEGSAACFLLCLIMFFGIFPLIPHLLERWHGHMPVQIGIAASLSITILELFPIRITRAVTINDNLIVPLVTGVIIVLL